MAQMKGSKRWMKACRIAKGGMWTKEEKRIKSKQWKMEKAKRAYHYLEWFRKFKKITNSTRILQIGAGPEGEVHFMGIGKRYAIDPLADFFKEKYKDIHDPRVEFVQAKGENLPYNDNFFDLIIMTNVLDHTDDDRKVLSELRRVLKDDGYANIEVHVFSKIGHLLRTIYHDPGHPYNYTPEMLRRRIIKSGFRIVDERHDSKPISYRRKGAGAFRNAWRLVMDRIWKKRYNRYIVKKRLV